MPARENLIVNRLQRAFRVRSGRGAGVQLGIGDDAALFAPSPGKQTVLSCDWFLEGTHFLRHKHPADAVGWKCLARALSDLAAMGAEPRCFLLSLALPKSHTTSWLDEFLRGLRRAGRRYGCSLAGGDTTRCESIFISVTVLGEIAVGRALLRSGAKPGDVVYVSGTLGEAEVGLGLLRSTKTAGRQNRSTLRKHLYPEPRIPLGAWLAMKRFPTAMMDLSDGLSTDLARLCAASGVGAEIAAEKLPAVDRAIGSTIAKRSPVDLALHAGDDYELLFTVPPNLAPQLPESFDGIRLTAIGRITSKPSITVTSSAGKRAVLEPRGWDPFRK